MHGLNVAPQSQRDALIFAALLYDALDLEYLRSNTLPFKRLLRYLEKRSGTTIDELGLNWFA